MRLKSDEKLKLMNIFANIQPLKGMIDFHFSYDGRNLYNCQSRKYGSPLPTVGRDVS